LRTRYHCYLASGTPHLTADVHWAGRSHAGYLADASMAFADGTLRLTAPGYDGAVDVKQGRAWLQFSSAVGGVLVPRWSPDDGARGGGLKQRALIRELTKTGC